MRLFASGRLLLLAHLVLPFACAGCSASFPLGGLSGEDEASARIITGATKRASAVTSGNGAQADLALAKVAAAELLTQGRKDASLPWENPDTGASGTVTALAGSRPQADGTLCQDFLASHVLRNSESWYQGEGCRREGRWVVRDLRPLQRT